MSEQRCFGCKKTAEFFFLGDTTGSCSDSGVASNIERLRSFVLNRGGGVVPRLCIDLELQWLGTCSSSAPP